MVFLVLEGSDGSRSLSGVFLLFQAFLDLLGVDSLASVGSPCLWFFLLVVSFLLESSFLFGSRSCVRSCLFRRFRSFLLSSSVGISPFSLECASSLSVSSLVFWSVFGGSPFSSSRYWSFLLPLRFRLFGSVSFFSFPCRLSESPVSVVRFLLLSCGFVDVLLPPLRLVRFLLSSGSSWNGFPSESRCTVWLRTVLFLPCG